MNAFLYMVCILAEIGVFSTLGFLLWNLTDYDALKILVIDIMVTFSATIVILEKMEETRGKKMSNKLIENNQVELKGCIVSNLVFNHKVFGERFYTMYLEVERLSGSTDVIPLMISERLIDVSENYCGECVCVRGQFRSCMNHEEKKNKLLLSVFVREFEFLDKVDSESNFIFLDGYICKTPVYRKTPLGREIADVFLAVNRPYGKSDYIPCLYWGRNARFAAQLKIGDRVQICGRIQSREYKKMISDEEFETRIAYEVSASKMEVIGDE